MHCQSCGLPVSPTTPVCPRCGQPISPPGPMAQQRPPRGSLPSTDQFSLSRMVKSEPLQRYPRLTATDAPAQPGQGYYPPITQLSPGLTPGGAAFPPQGSGQTPAVGQAQLPGAPAQAPISPRFPVGGAAAPLSTQPGPFYPAGMNAQIFSAPMPPVSFPSQSLTSGPFPGPLPSSPVPGQPFVSGPFPGPHAQPGSIPPQGFNGQPFPAPAPSNPIMPPGLRGQAFSTATPFRPVQGPQAAPGSLPAAPLPPGSMPPVGLTSQPFANPSMPSAPVLPQALTSGTFPLPAPGQIIQQHSPVGVVRSASVIQAHKTPSTRKVLIAVGTGFIVALILAVGYLALLQKPAPQQATMAVKQVVQTHPKKMPQRAPITTSDPQELYTQATAWQTVSDDPLSAQSDNDWETVNSPGSCAFDGNTLHAQNTAPDTRVTMCIANATKYKNIAFQAKLTLLKGDTYGMVVRADNKTHQLYLFSISSNGTYTLAVNNGQNGTLAHVLAAGTSSEIKQGPNQSNQLTLITRDTTLYLYINQKFITKVDDGTATSGNIGLFVGNSQGDSSEARFTSVKVWNI